MPSTADLNIIRSWVGPNVGGVDDGFDGTDIDERIGRLGTAEAAALEVLRTIHAGMAVDDPAIMSITGDYSESKVENMKAIDDKIGQLERLTGSGTVSVSRLVRPRRR